MLTIPKATLLFATLFLIAISTLIQFAWLIGYLLIVSMVIFFLVKFK